tara:strand:+ start:3260 stop:6160 length:2901 start_codon:yes stop_codon:yes gene_type:complete
MTSSAERTITELPETLQPAAQLWVEQVIDDGHTIPDDLLAPLLRCVACSEFAATTLRREFTWFVANAASFAHTADSSNLDSFVEWTQKNCSDQAELKSALRKFRNRFLLRVLWREVHRLADVKETLTQLSLLADRLLEVAMRAAEQDLHSRFGLVRNRDGEKVSLVVLGMGKLGGRELNFSSDIDLIFCYPEDGVTDGERSLSAQEYFTRMTRYVIALLDEVTADGFVFRVDTRLRPFGESGPPIVSFAALESYLLQHGRDWERYAYVKARIVGWQPPSPVAESLYTQLIQPFVYRRYLDYGVFESVREMQRLIATEVRRRELEHNVKLGPGGIREAEFIVQAMQLVRGGSEVELQSRELLTVLPKLVNERGLTAAAADELAIAYCYLRRVENFIQAIRDQQTHDLPDSETDRERLRLAMQCESWDTFFAKLSEHRQTISTHFNSIAFRDDDDDRPAEHSFRQLWESSASAERWADALRNAGSLDGEILATHIVDFAALPGTQQIDSVSGERLRRFMPKLLATVVESPRPVAALRRTLAITQGILRRSAYLALLNENQHAMSRLVGLCGRSQYIANQIARYPALLDELLDPCGYTDEITRAEIEAELKQKLSGVDTTDSELQVQTIAQFQRATMFRIAVADFNDQLSIMKVSDALTWLAEVVLEEALRVAWNDLVARHGAPHYVRDGIRHPAGFGVVAYGKLGGIELSYGSDLDIVFLHDSAGEKQMTDGDRPQDNALFFSRLVRKLVHFLTTQTGSGALYEVDTRLRPDGRSGLLVTNTEAFETYQVENAWTWEHQALLRARAVAGSASIAAEFERIRRETLSNRVRRKQLREDVVSMRRKMRDKLDRSDGSHFDLKHGQGGIGDIEFLVQYLVLREAKSHPEVTCYSDNIRQIDALIDAGIIADPPGRQLQDVYRVYRLHLHRRVLNGQNALCGPDRFVSEREFVASLWDDWLGGDAYNSLSRQ